MDAVDQHKTAGRRKVNCDLKTLYNIPSNESKLFSILSTNRYTDEQSFDCPVCFSMVLPPIKLVCENHHTVCNPCLDKLEPRLCPKCRQDISRCPVRCFEAEKILQWILANTNVARCQYSLIGCTFTKGHRQCDQLSEHEEGCAFRLVKMTDELNRLYDEFETRRIIHKLK